MMRIGNCADATAAICRWLEEIDGLVDEAFAVARRYRDGVGKMMVRP